MKLATGVNILRSKNVEKAISKKILLANTSDKTITGKTLSKSILPAADPMYMSDRELMNNQFNPDIRYRNNIAYSPLNQINYRNDLLLFAENNAVKKAVNIMANETVIIDLDTHRYPVYPKINDTLIDTDKKSISKAIQEYLDTVFYPKLWKYYNFKDEGLIEKIKEFKITGKIAYEIIYDNPKSPKDIIGIIPIDASCLQKIKIGDFLYYIYNEVSGSQNGNRILHENQLILIEYNKFDYGYVSFVDKLRVPYNVMESMQKSKALWFAAKSQVRMHVKLAMGDVPRLDAIEKLVETKNQYTNKFTFADDGRVLWNNKPNNSGYREFFTAESAASGTPEIEEINTNGPDLTEVDSLNYWDKVYWKETNIPYDRIDPNSSDSWGFTDVTSLRKIEVNFAKDINADRKILNELFIKPIIIQLTLKEVEIGIDLSLLDSIKMEWIAFNQYEKLAELEILQKKIDIATSLSAFGEIEDSEGRMRKHFPISWISKNYLDFTDQQYESMEYERLEEDKKLGYLEGSNMDDEDEEIEDEEIEDEEIENEDTDDSAKNIRTYDDDQY